VQAAATGLEDPSRVVETVESAQERIQHHVRAWARHRLWRLTGDREHLDEAHRLFLHARANAPGECAENIGTRQPTYRAIREDFERLGR